ncbi:MAG: hypothetical protein ACFFHD_00275 [Promethearchaeota archaeon]
MEKEKIIIAVLAIVLILVISIETPLLIISTTKKAEEADDGWDLIINNRASYPYPDLREYYWEKVPNQLPNGEYDRIGLARVVDYDATIRDVVFILPGTWSCGTQLIGQHDSPFYYTREESRAYALYLANRGFDVYSIDYRTYFINDTIDITKTDFMKDWGWDQWISDIKECVNKVKKISGMNKIFMAGQSFGGGAMENYASVYWEEDLKGLIGLDGGSGGKYEAGTTNTHNLTEALDAVPSGGWAMDRAYHHVFKYAYQYPGAPAIDPYTLEPIPGGFDNISMFAKFYLTVASLSNMSGGYGTLMPMMSILAGLTRYWPIRLGIESTNIRDWNSSTQVTTDFDENIINIDLPYFGVHSALSGVGTFLYGTADPDDFTAIDLPYYQHLDIYAGEKMEEDISEPLVEWLIAHG